MIWTCVKINNILQAPPPIGHRRYVDDHPHPDPGAQDINQTLPHLAGLLQALLDRRDPEYDALITLPRENYRNVAPLRGVVQPNAYLTDRDGETWIAAAATHLDATWRKPIDKSPLTVRILPKGPEELFRLVKLAFRLREAELSETQREDGTYEMYVSEPAAADDRRGHEQNEAAAGAREPKGVARALPPSQKKIGSRGPRTSTQS